MPPVAVAPPAPPPPAEPSLAPAASPAADSSWPEPQESQPLPPELYPDHSLLVTEDDTPMDNLFSEKQQRLLVRSLEAGWGGGPEEAAFAAAANVGLYFSTGQTPLVPDFLLSLDVAWADDLWKKENRCYLTWMFGKAPELVVEIVSNRVGGEDNRKRELYARGGVDHYVIFDPAGRLVGPPLRYFRRGLSRRYEEVGELVIPGFPLTLRPWTGVFERKENTWLRWFHRDTGALVPTGIERADAQQQRADAQQQRADAQQQRADAQQQRADRLAEQLRALGVDPAQV